MLLGKILDKLDAEQESKRLAQEFGLRYNWLENKIHGQTHQHTTDGLNQRRTMLKVATEATTELGNSENDEKKITRYINNCGYSLHSTTSRAHNIVHPYSRSIPCVDNYRTHLNRYSDNRDCDTQMKPFSWMKKYTNDTRYTSSVKEDTPTIHERPWITSDARPHEVNEDGQTDSHQLQMESFKEYDKGQYKGLCMSGKNDHVQDFTKHTDIFEDASVPLDFSSKGQTIIDLSFRAKIHYQRHPHIFPKLNEQGQQQPVDLSKKVINKGKHMNKQPRLIIHA